MPALPFAMANASQIVHIGELGSENENADSSHKKGGTKPSYAYGVWTDHSSGTPRHCDAVPLRDVPAVVDDIPRQLRTRTVRINGTRHVQVAATNSSKPSLRKGTIESISADATDGNAHCWLVREVLLCDPGCVGCTFHLRLTVYSSSPQTCVVETCGEHGQRGKPIKLRMGESTRTTMRQLVKSRVASTPKQVLRHLRHTLMPLLHKRRSSPEGRFSAKQCSVRYQPSYAQVKKQLVRDFGRYDRETACQCVQFCCKAMQSLGHGLRSSALSLTAQKVFKSRKR